MPTDGGSYIRQKDGSLKLAEEATRPTAGGGPRDRDGKPLDAPAESQAPAAAPDNVSPIDGGKKK